MNLVNEIGSEIAIALTCDVRYREKLHDQRIRETILRVRKVLEGTSRKLSDGPPLNALKFGTTYTPGA